MGGHVTNCMNKIGASHYQEIFEDVCKNAGPKTLKDVILVMKALNECAYCFTRANLAKVDILLIPYNYVLSSSIRKSINLRLRNNIIIFDEAHNIEHDAEEAASVTITMKELLELKKSTN